MSKIFRGFAPRPHAYAASVGAQPQNPEALPAFPSENAVICFCVLIIKN